MSKHFEFNSKGFEKHACTGRREGEWLIFECPECGYVRKWNPKTHQMKVENHGDENALHAGSYEPTGLQLAHISMN